MATFTYADLGGGIDMTLTTTDGVLGYKFWSASSTSLKLYDNSSNYTLFTGSGLKVTSKSGTLTDITAGTVTGIKGVTAGKVAVTVTGLSVSAVKLGDAVFAHDDAAFLSVLLAGNDTINGTAYGDGLLGGAGNDILKGNGGDDSLMGAIGADQLLGGTGFDTVFYVAATKGVVASLAKPSLNTNEAKGDTYSSIEGLVGSRFADSLTGNSGANYLSGQAGNDVLDGGAGDDALAGGAGADTLRGGDGRDMVDYAFATKGVVASLAKSSINTNDAKGDIYSSIEELQGSEFSDKLYGNGSANGLAGLKGNDVVDGGGGNDIIYGDAGADDLTGGTGKDTFAYFAASDSKVAASGRDTIFDFSASQGDKIDLSDIDAISKSTKDDAFTFIGTAAFHGKAGELRYVKQSSDTYVYADINGDKTADFAIHFDDALTLSKGYFVL
ncbi:MULTISPECIES: calcium-binding protein [unclassified Rhizobium]|uniref:calcium-binding protein n=1 Tax=unclassified Rhizobium TaxID=2613769 RepID=UPI0007147A87|nr:MULTISPECIES: calcium-binding protein [unclassified Rhizobium]KQS96672.1 hypothetical protein ASG50_06460 [Rhizobium sp. Leaf386]KQT06512.1 hypothetical protein ASG42_02705 [Rhizobium sp. Leaf391]KQT92583.1 hypothetical protein ASG68_17460 [Rhizobium sp. Leaf453]